jgi:UDP-N-acetylmuramoyl-tripeptide--D-alanyl-D-alanine ligase
VTPFTISLDELLASTGGTLVGAKVDESFTGATLDGRNARPGEIYFAIVGDRHDGHEFTGQAVAAGAKALVVQKGRRAGGWAVTLVEVDDTRLAMGALARAVRRRSRAKVVAVTGSTGKTTTKGLIASMLSGVAGPSAVVATEGSLNNETGVPQTLLRLREGHRFAVVEMGMRGLGQIDYLCQLAEPDVGVVVNAGVAHVGVVGSVADIARGKSEVWARLPAHGMAVYPHADARLRDHALERGVPVERHATFGHEAGATVQIVRVVTRGTGGSEVELVIRGRTVKLRVPLVGRHNVDNAACALAAAVALDVDLAQACRGLEHATAPRHRSELTEIGGRHVLVDCYNANPTSMRAALETLAELRAGHRAVAILGDMLELGATEEEEHAEVGRLAARLGLDALVAFGERARHTARAASSAGLWHIVESNDPVQAARVAASWTEPGDWILVKASRGMRLERVIEALREIVV